MNTELEHLETEEELQEVLRAAQQKIANLRAAEEEEELKQNLVEMPIANVRIRLSKFQDVLVEKVTPAQLAYLVAEHHQKAGGNPVLEIKPLGKTQRDPRYERARLCMLHKKDKVMAMFPGQEPVLPRSFARAIENGLLARGAGEDKFVMKMSLSEASGN